MTVSVANQELHAAPSAYGDNAIISMHRCNCNWKFGAGLSYDHYYLGVGGGIGILNMSDIKVLYPLRELFRGISRIQLLTTLPITNQIFMIYTRQTPIAHAQIWQSGVTIYIIL